MMNRTNVWAIIGASEGLGPATIKYLLSRQQVVIALAPDESAVRKLQQLGCDDLEITTLFSDAAAGSCKSLEELRSCYGPIDTLIDNFSYGMETNLQNTIAIVKQVRPYIRPWPQGKIICMPPKPFWYFKQLKNGLEKLEDKITYYDSFISRK